MNLSGKTCMITGANSGMGFAAAKQFAQLGANVILVCRDDEKGKKAIAEVKKEVPEAMLELMICDFASLKSTYNFIHKFKETHSKLNVLFNNAAALRKCRTITEDGYELMFQTNFLAPVLLTTSFLDLLKSNSPARIINIAVPPEKLRIDFGDLQFSKQYKPFDDFMRTKLYLLLYSLELSQKLARTDVIINSINPGLFKSELRRDSPWLLGKIMDLFAISADQAAAKILFHVCSNEIEANSGKIFNGMQEKPPITYWNDSNIRECLWEITEVLIDKIERTYE